MLGRTVSGEGLSVTNAQRESILHHPKPLTVSAMLSFLGLTGYSRSHVPNYTGLTTPLRDIVKVAGPRNLTAQLQWTTSRRSFLPDQTTAYTECCPSLP